MLEPAIKTTLTLPTQEVYYRLYRFDSAPPRRLLLLHGGGVAGRITWGGILPHLRHWNEVLVPDLRGTGKTRYPGHHDHSFEAEEVVADLTALLDHLGWDKFDLGGYSYGGMIAMLLKAARPAAVEKTYLLEPALLGKLNDEESIRARALILHAAKRLRNLENVEEGLQLFLDAVAPNRTRGSKNEEIIRSRLSHRPAGLACAIECVSHAAHRLDRAALIAAQAKVSSFIGGRSHPEVYRRCQEIAEGKNDWTCHLIQGADHALPFQKPELIAELMNGDLEKLQAINAAMELLDPRQEPKM
ncbi:MAG: alpha/beta fold hydrolase [Sulfuricella sp.]|nr:alpha/beta hydrolase [Gammaproteobacteria bacterium]